MKLLSYLNTPVGLPAGAFRKKNKINWKALGYFFAPIPTIYYNNYQKQKEAQRRQNELYYDAQNFNRQQQEYQNFWNREQWDAQNKYNTPSSSVARLISAGINPKVAFDTAGGSAGNAGAPAQGTSPASSPQPPQLQAAQFPISQMIQDTASLVGAAQGVANIGKIASDIGLNKAQAQQAQAAANQIDTLLPFQVEITKWEGAMKKFEYDLQSLYGADMIQADLKVKFGQYYQSMAAGDQAQADAALKDIQTQIETDKRNAGFVDVFMDNLKKQGQMFSAQANQANESARDMRATRQARIDNLKADSDLKKSIEKLNNLDFNVRSPNQQKEIAAAAKELDEQVKRSDVYTKEMRNQMEYWKAQAEKAAKEADWRKYTMCMEMFRDAAIGGAALASGAKNVKSMRTPKPPKKPYTSPNTSSTPHDGNTYYPKSSSTWENVEW